jgi:hypothetical protein
MPRRVLRGTSRHLTNPANLLVEEMPKGVTVSIRMGRLDGHSNILSRDCRLKSDHQMRARLVLEEADVAAMRVDRLYSVPADVTATSQWVRRGLEASFEHHLVDRPVDCLFADDERLHACEQHDLLDEIIDGPREDLVFIELLDPGDRLPDKAGKELIQWSPLEEHQHATEC